MNRAILFLQLGGPETLDDVRGFLYRLFSDPDVITVRSNLLRKAIAASIALGRQKASRALYASIGGGSPIRRLTEEQARGVEAVLRAAGRDAVVRAAMTCSAPLVEDVVAELAAAGVDRFLALPLYPQYCSATTGSVFDAVSAELQRWRWVPALRFVDHYHDDPRYVAALAQSVREHWRKQSPGERLLFSFHGIPKRSVLAGDPYYCQCLKTARLTAETLALPAEQWAVSFQSRLGRAEWLKPYTAELLPQWARDGIRRVDVLCPGFSADCVETLEEIAIRNREYFEGAGGTSLSYIPALNARADHISFLADFALEQLQSWPEVDMPSDPEVIAERGRRARELGASH